jgi:hypothetical protein
MPTYGSWAARHEGYPSGGPKDVDVLVVGGADVDALAESVATRLNREVNVRRVRPARWAEPGNDQALPAPSPRPARLRARRSGLRRAVRVGTWGDRNHRDEGCLLVDAIHDPISPAAGTPSIIERRHQLLSHPMRIGRARALDESERCDGHGLGKSIGPLASGGSRESIRVGHPDKPRRRMASRTSSRDSIRSAPRSPSASIS